VGAIIVQGTPSKFSPVALDIRGVPTNDLTASVHAEFDPTYRSLRTISANGQYNWSNQVQTSFGWSKRGLIPQLPGFDNTAFLDQSINSLTTVRTRDSKYGTTYSWNYDVLHSTMLQQRITAFYNAQCCGVAFEYQAYHFIYTGAPIPADHRFFMSFTLAGLGNFSPFNGALSGVPR
jgi:hypothetical protein